jgi:hypothetical protein
LVQRFKSHDRGTVHIHIEENGHVPEQQLRGSIATIYRDLETRNERRPVIVPNVRIQTKREEPAFSLPDCLLWIFGRTFGAVDGAPDADYLRFERLREKYRHIIDVDSAEVFSRRHPIEIRRRPITRGPPSSNLRHPTLDP